MGNSIFGPDKDIDKMIRQQENIKNWKAKYSRICHFGHWQKHAKQNILLIFLSFFLSNAFRILKKNRFLFLRVTKCFIAKVFTIIIVLFLRLLQSLDLTFSGCATKKFVHFYEHNISKSDFYARFVCCQPEKS